MRADEAGHQIGGVVVTEGVHGGQSQRALRHALVPHAFDRQVDAAIGRLGGVVEQLAGLGQLHAAPGAQEQRLADAGLQRGQLPAQSRLRLVQRVGRADRDPSSAMQMK